jgi:hypothetical protein
MNGGTSGLGIRGSGLGAFAGLLFTFISLGFAAVPPGSGAEPDFTVTVRVYDYARIGRETLAKGEIETTEILRRAGIELAWIDCTLAASGGKLQPVCQEDLGPTDISLRILPRSMSVHSPFRDNTLGFAGLSGEGEQGTMASIFYFGVQDLARMGDVPEHKILGHAIAHEIGHLLLRTIGHTSSGIMRVTWGRKDLKRLNMEGLFFTEVQAEVMRVEVRARRTQQEAARIASEHPRR